MPFMGITFEKTEELLAQGQSPTAPANQAWLVETSTNLAAERLRQQYHLSMTDVRRVIEDYLRAQGK